MSPRRRLVAVMFTKPSTILSTLFLMLSALSSSLSGQAVVTIDLLRDSSCLTYLEDVPPGVVFNRSDPCVLFFDSSIGADHIYEIKDYPTEEQQQLKFTFNDPKILWVGSIKRS